MEGHLSNFYTSLLKYCNIIQCVDVVSTLNETVCQQVNFRDHNPTTKDIFREFFCL